MEFTPQMLEKLAASADGLPIYLDQRPPRIEDPSLALDDHHWQPACTTTNKLTRCLEGIRDVAVGLALLAGQEQPETEKRLVKQLITPIFNLAIGLRDLYNDVLSNSWKRVAKPEQRKLALAFRAFQTAAPTGVGALKAARDKIAAHLDKDLSTTQYRQFWESFSIADVLGWIRGCIKMLDALLPPDVYSWTRFSGYSNVWNIMNVDGKEVSLLIKDGQPEALIGFQLVVSPKWGIAEEARELGLTAIRLGKRLGINLGTTWKLRQ